MGKAIIKCPCCGSENRHVYQFPSHPELKASDIEIMSFKFEGVTICKLVCCEDCGCIYDLEVAKKIVRKS